MKKGILHLFVLISVYTQIYGQLNGFFVTPHSIDTTYATSDDSNYVALNPSVTSNNKLLVFLPGTTAKTKVYLDFPNLAANLGYHCVSVAYPNGAPTVASLCAGNADTNCYYNIRQEVCYGTDVSSNVSVDTLHSIRMRLIKLLQYLSTNYPSQNWGQFLNGSEPNWPAIAVTGHSQGSGHALYFSKTQTCERLIMFAGADDYSNYYGSAANWTFRPGLTPKSHFFSFLHLNDDVWAYSKQFAVAQAAGMTANGDDSTSVNNLLSPYNNSHCLYTSIVPLYPGIYSSYHNSMVVDFYVPKDNQGQPIYIPVWTYMLTADVATGIDKTTKDNPVFVFPNPSTGILNIMLPQAKEHMNIKLFNSLGQQVFNKDYSLSSNVQMETSPYENGFYILQVSQNGQPYYSQKVSIINP